jgi:dsDNA-specific endonuclease/ATPase MutS2
MKKFLDDAEELDVKYKSIMLDFAIAELKFYKEVGSNFPQLNVTSYLDIINKRIEEIKNH